MHTAEVRWECSAASSISPFRAALCCALSALRMLMRNSLCSVPTLFSLEIPDTAFQNTHTASPTRRDWLGATFHYRGQTGMTRTWLIHLNWPSKWPEALAGPDWLYIADEDLSTLNLASDWINMHKVCYRCRILIWPTCCRRRGWED